MNQHSNSSLHQHQNQDSNSKTKQLVGKSEFTRGKLEKDYQPKLKCKSFKHKLLKTSQHCKLVAQRLQNEQDEQKVTSSALQCFKRGQVIDLDWKTKSNFRKSNIGLKLPRINTQPLQLMLEKSLSNKSNRSNPLQNFHSRVLQNKSIESKCSKLKELLNFQIGQSRSFFKSSKSSQMAESKGDFSRSLLFQNKQKESIKQKEKNKMGQSNIIISSPVAGISVNLSQLLCKKELKNHKDNDIKFQDMRSQTEELKDLRVFQINQNKSERSRQRDCRLQTLQSQSQMMENLKNQNSQSQQSIIKKVMLSPQDKDQTKNYQSYDILNDPNMYLLIERSRERIIDFKQLLILKNMSKLQRLKYFEQKNAVRQPQQNPVRSKSLSLPKDAKINSKNKIVSKIECKKKSISQKINKDVSRVFTQIQDYVKNAQVEQSKHCSHIFSYLNIKSQGGTQQNQERKLMGRGQSKIKSRKKRSLVQVQQKLLKQVKLSFLKEDLTKKFEQIRKYHQSINKGD